MSASAPNVNRLRTPQQLTADATDHAHRRRSVYATRAVKALSSPVLALREFISDQDAVHAAAEVLRDQSTAIRDCCTEAHPVPVLARQGDDGPAFVTDAKIAPHHCGRPLCDRCERRPETHKKSAMRLGAALTGALLRRATVRFLTLPVTNRTRLAAAHQELADATVDLRKTPEWAHHIEGGTRALEVTHNDGKRRRLRRHIAAAHGLMLPQKHRKAYVEKTERRQDADGAWFTVTRKQELTERDATEFLDNLHDAGADIYRETPWESRHCAGHGVKGCTECDPRGWHPHHHMIVEGRFWLGLCEVCQRHGRFNCGECRKVNAERTRKHKDGKPAPDAAPFVRVCGGRRTQAELATLRQRGARRMSGETQRDHNKRMRRHGQAFDWMRRSTQGKCLTTQTRLQLNNQIRLGNAKSWTPRREKDVARLHRKLASIDRRDFSYYDTAARCLSCAWSDVTDGQSYVVDVRSVKGWAQALQGTAVKEAVDGVGAELLKYLTKSAVMPADAMVEFAWVMRRKRRVAWFGTWQGLDVTEPDPIELKCGTTWAVLWDSIHQRYGEPQRLYFKGPEPLCLALARKYPGVRLDPTDRPDRYRGDCDWLAGSVIVDPVWGKRLYLKASGHIPEPPADVAYTSRDGPGANDKGAAPTGATPEASALLLPF